MHMLRAPRDRRLVLIVARAQAWYYLVGGLWRLVHPISFEAVAGPKPDQFQTDATAALFMATGAALLVGTRTTEPEPSTRTLAIAAGTVVACIDVKHRRDIRALFQAEAALELAFAAAAALGATRLFPRPGSGVPAQDG